MPSSDSKYVQYSDSDARVVVLDGAVSARIINHPERSFAIEATLDLIKGDKFFATKPPIHFHIQEEYIESIQGKLGLEIDGIERVLTPADGRIPIKPYVNHRSYPIPLPRQEGGITAVKFLLSGKRTKNVFELNPVFFENWYRYQDDVLNSGGKIDIIQVFCTFDAGGTYVTLPWWVPFGQTVSIALGVVLGRWLGSGLLGYQPFYRKWTSDWALACKKMGSTVFQKRFASRPKAL